MASVLLNYVAFFQLQNPPFSILLSFRFNATKFFETKAKPHRFSSNVCHMMTFAKLWWKKASGFYVSGEFRFLKRCVSISTTLQCQIEATWLLFRTFLEGVLGYIGQAIIGVKIANSSHVASIQH